MNTHHNENNLYLEWSYSYITFGERNLGKELRISHGDTNNLIVQSDESDWVYAGKSGRGGTTGLGTEATLF